MNSYFQNEYCWETAAELAEPNALLNYEVIVRFVAKNDWTTWIFHQVISTPPPLPVLATTFLYLVDIYDANSQDKLNKTNIKLKWKTKFGTTGISHVHGNQDRFIDTSKYQCPIFDCLYIIILPHLFTNIVFFSLFVPFYLPQIPSMFWLKVTFLKKL